MSIAVNAALAVAGAAYLNAKYHIAKDVRTISTGKKAERLYAAKVAQKRASIWYPIEEQVLLEQDKRLIWSRDGSYSWKETYEYSNQYAHFFLSLGVKPGDIVNMYVKNRPEFCFIWLGLLAIGCSPAFINYNLAAESLTHCLKISGAKVTIVDGDEDCRQRIEDQRSIIEGHGQTIYTLDEPLKQKIASLPSSRVEDQYRDNVTPASSVALIYTSGTTGLPKAFGYQMGRVYGPSITGARYREGVASPDGNNSWYIPMPLYHGTAATCFLFNAAAGLGVAIGRKFSTKTYWDDVRASGATGIVYVGEAIRYLLSAPPSPLDKQHRVLVAYGNGLRPDVWHKFQQRFGIPNVIEFYDSTEGQLGLAVFDRSGFHSATVGHSGLLLRFLLRKVWVPVAADPSTGEMWRDPATGFAKRVPYQQGGEILVKLNKPTDWPGYWNAKEATNKKFRRDVFEKGDVYYCPGDALRRDADGHWYFLDRLGDTYRWKGENVSTAEVGAVLGSYGGVNEANLYGIELPHTDGRAGCAAMELSAPSKFDWNGFAEHCFAKLPRYAVPVFVRVVAAEEESESGKMGSHNAKQNKVGYRAEGVDPSKQGKFVKGGEQDQIWWIAPGTKTYTKFTDKDWHAIERQEAKL